jgi:hypothetical protein
VSSNREDDVARDRELEPLEESVTRPSAARVYDYLIGGGHFFSVDEEFAEKKLKQILPRIGDYAIENRKWVGRVVRWAVREGYRQFVDIGSGVPSAGNVHEIADQVAPDRDTRVVYIDNDPVAYAYGRLVLEETGDRNRHAAIQADMLEETALWRQVTGTGLIDPDQPVVLLIAAVLHFVKDEHDPDRTLHFYRSQLAKGSVLALSTVTNESPADDEEAEALRRLVRFYEETTNPGQLRTVDEFRRFFGAWDLVDPGLVYVTEWRPDGTSLFPENPSGCRVVGGVGRKTG